MDYKALTKEFLDDMFLKKPPYKKVLELSKGELGTLLYLVKENDDAVVGDISKRLGLTSGRMASVLKRLESKEFIVKKRSIGDKRVTIVSSTKKGQDFVNNHGKEVFDRIHNLLRFLGEEDALAYVRINKRLHNEFDQNKSY
ncbi:MAG: MarR family winged helix-turn-helix transcriptional regulator [Candidatus Izemoplasmatales bacterium]